MRFASIHLDGQVRPGVLARDEIALFSPAIPDLVGFLELDEEARGSTIRQALASGLRVPRSTARLAAPIRRFRRDVLCTGWNYWDHFEEGRGKREGQDVDKPKAPTFFTKSPDVVIGPNDAIAFDPRISQKWDYEAELVVIIGRTGRSIPRASAWEHIFGVSLANDISQRDLQRRHGGQWLKGKSIDQSMPLGPVIVTPDQLDIPRVRLRCDVNGQTVQDAVVAQMAFPIDELIAELSFGMTLHAGDVILTGTPSGVGNAREPQLFLKAGDQVVVRGDGIGELCNTLVPQDLAGHSDIRLD
ncbi:fumarylacetoacetate hydrolase family protein [Bradyrhizobium prioriisuperbiae]|uniref:fumarylacetoacetate hydrolase family protein n=1 Tax=Bradyrhizobium prioriisuperbiae TaxID=2854389 RepID=UPI0028E61F7E|nr:fumarylacetoacetate hydrolase family protein [Bradyrhizobium prioritasuperba]